MITHGMITHEILVKDMLKCPEGFIDGYNGFAFHTCDECREHLVTEYEDSIREEAREKALNEVRKRVMDTIGHKVWETSSNAFKTAFNKIIDEVMEGGENE